MPYNNPTIYLTPSPYRIISRKSMARARRCLSPTSLAQPSQGQYTWTIPQSHTEILSLWAATTRWNYSSTPVQLLEHAEWREVCWKKTFFVLRMVKSVTRWEHLPNTTVPRPQRRHPHSTTPPPPARGFPTTKGHSALIPVRSGVMEAHGYDVFVSDLDGTPPAPQPAAVAGYLQSSLTAAQATALVHCERDTADTALTPTSPSTSQSRRSILDTLPIGVTIRKRNVLQPKQPFQIVDCVSRSKNRRTSQHEKLSMVQRTPTLCK